jgi:uracil-DNA glycosylase
MKDLPPDSVPKSKCRYHLTYQWAAVQPKIIVCLGKVILSAVLGSDTKADLVKPNEIVDSKFGPVIFNWHPASAMRNPNRESKALEFARLGNTFDLALAYCGYKINND